MKGRAWSLFALTASLVLFLIFALAEAENRQLLRMPTGTTRALVPAAVQSDRLDWAKNGDFSRLEAGSSAAPLDWHVFEVTSVGARLLRSRGESFLRLDCGERLCIAGFWQRHANLPTGEYLLEAEVFLRSEQGGASARIGYDARGGVDATDDEVHWSGAAASDGWQRLSLGFRHEAGPATVFIIFDRLDATAECRLAAARLFGPAAQTDATGEPPPITVQAVRTEPKVLELRALYVRAADLHWSGPEELQAVAHAAAASGFNAIYFQVREQGYAYYRSGLEPIAPVLAGADFDPLNEMVRAAHDSGLQVHAWVEALPTWRDGAAPPPSSPEHLYNLFVARYGTSWMQARAPALQGKRGEVLYASPANEQVRLYLTSLCADIAARYQVDGLHLTDVGYAGGEYGASDPGFLAAQSQRPTLTLAEWRAGQVSALLAAVAEAIAGVRPRAQLSVGVWPPVRDDSGSGATQGYAEYGEDARGWLSAGLVDAIVPLLFRQPDEQAPERLRALVAGYAAESRGRLVVVALGAENGGFSDLASSLDAARQAGADGVALFSYGALERRGFWEELAAGPFVQPAAPPPLPWQ